MPPQNKVGIQNATAYIEQCYAFVNATDEVDGKDIHILPQDERAIILAEIKQLERRSERLQDGRNNLKFWVNYRRKIAYLLDDASILRQTLEEVQYYKRQGENRRTTEKTRVLMPVIPEDQTIDEISQELDRFSIADNFNLGLIGGGSDVSSIRSAPSIQTRRDSESIFDDSVVYEADTPSTSVSETPVSSIDVDEYEIDLQERKSRIQDMLNNCTRIIFDRLDDPSDLQQGTKKLLRYADDKTKCVHIGDYSGGGGYGEVYSGDLFREADNEIIPQGIVAVKRLHSKHGKKKDAGERRSKLYIEGHIASLLHHTNIVRCFGIFEPPINLPYELYIVSEFVHGNMNAREFLSEYESTEVSEKLFHDMLCGLSYMHEEDATRNKQKVCHGDLKGNNVLVDFEPLKDEKIPKFPVGKIADFGLSSIISEGQSYIHSDQSGALPWIAPELVKLSVKEGSGKEARAALLEKGDVWSFAMTVLEIVNNECPFEDMEPPELFRALSADDCDLNTHWRLAQEMPEATAGRLSDQACRVLRKCWEILPEHRPRISEVKSTYENLLAASEQATEGE